jgi:hypothetical protein
MITNPAVASMSVSMPLTFGTFTATFLQVQEVDGAVGRRGSYRLGAGIGPVGPAADRYPRSSWFTIALSRPWRRNDGIGQVAH